MYRKFSSFAELIADFAGREGTALMYAAEDDTDISTISYAKLASMINAEAARVKAEGTEVALVLDEKTPASIVSVFAHVIAGCDILLADPMVPAEATDMAVAAVKASRAAREPEGEGELLFFTSGTTSRSKIVRLTSKSFCTSAWSGQSMLACGTDDVLLCVLPLSHVFGFVCALLWGFCYGAAVALGRGVRHMIDDTLFFRPTIIPAVPTLIGAMYKFDTINPEARIALVGAAPCTPEVAAALRTKGIDVYLGYGLTETSSGIAITQDLDEPEALYPCPGADFKIESDGEVSVATPCMMRGYIGARTMKEGERFYTGDLGWLDEKGRLHLKGRKKDVLILADGTKVFCPEYEDDLVKLTGLPDLGIIMKDGHAVLIAGSCPAEKSSAGKIEVKLKREIARFNKDFQRSQQIYDIIMRSEPLPRTVTGKLKRYELQEQYQ